MLHTIPTKPTKIIIIEVKVQLNINGLKQLLHYLTQAPKRYPPHIKEIKGALVFQTITKTDKPKIIELAEYHNIKLYQYQKEAHKEYFIRLQ